MYNHKRQAFNHRRCSCNSYRHQP